MLLKLAIVLCALAAAAATAPASVKPSAIKEKYQAEESRQLENYAQDAMTGVFSECFSQVSFSCLQRKVLNYVHRMGRMEQFDVLGQYVSVVKVKDDAESEPQFQARMDSYEKEQNLDDLVDATVDRFFNNHVIRVKLPSSMAVRQSTGRSTEVVDLQFPYTDEVEGRKKGGGGGGKMGKKMMMMMMMGLKAKMMMMGPMMMGLAGLMAMKALIAAIASLTISKIMIIKKLIKQKGSGGGGGHSHSSGWDSGSSSGGGGGWSSGGGGGGGGWDRRSSDYSSPNDGWDASDLAYRAYSTVENLL